MKNKIYSPTIEQLNATKIGMNISLSANAGAGKTSVLVDRYMKLLHSGVRINEIAAITFTKKAANEMIERISNRLDDFIAASTLNKNELRKYKILRKQLSGANISTIHSFCINILKDYVIEAGLEPNFRELTNFEKHKIIEEAIDDVLENVIQNNYEENDFAVDKYYKNKLFTYYKRNEIISILKLIINKSDLEEILEDIDNISFEKWNNKIKTAFYEQTKDDVNDFINKYGKYINVNILDEKNYFEVLDKIKDLYEIKKIKEDGSKSRNYLIPKKDRIDLPENDLNEIHFGLNKVIFAIYRKIKVEINVAKKMLNGIDFDDMLIKTRDLLINNRDIAFTISCRFKEIMVDEFQDTNNLQYDIVKALVPTIDSNVELAQNEVNQYPNVFIVGDIKQSIYRFRNADVKVFAEAIKNIEENNKKYFENKTKKYNYGKLALTTTFRTLPVITGFVNKVCKDLGLYGDNEVNIHELVCGRNNVKYKTEITENQRLSKEYGGSINFLVAIIDDKKNSDDLDNENSINNIEESEKEAKLIAQRIISIVNSPNNDYKYSDFAILYRSRTHINKLKNTFNDQNIPFLEQGSDRFWNAPEIIHILNYLNFLNDPNNDLACVGVLVSPFFAVSDSELLHIQYSHNGSVWENINNYLKNTHNTHNFRGVIRTLQEHIDLASNISITHLINIVLLNHNWIERLCLLKTDQARNAILNNIEKFVSKARDFQNRGYLSLYDFLIEVNTLREIDAVDSDVIEETDVNAVKLLTIHASKGLEFNNIILYNLSASARNTMLPIINKKFGLGIPVVDDSNVWRKMEKSFADYVIITEEKTEEYKENLRLLYVAMTRAKDNLYLSGTIKQKDNKTSSYGENSIFGKIIKSIGYNFEGIRELCIDNDCNEIVVKYPIKILDKAPIDVYVPINLYSYVSSDGIRRNNNVNNELDKLEVYKPIYNFIETGKILSFSKLFTTNDIDEHISKHLGININSNYILDNKFNENILSGVKKGLLYHDIMEKFKEWYVDGNIDEQFIKNIIINNLNINIDNNYNIITETILNIKKLVNSNLIQRYQSALIEAQFEYEIYLPFKNNYLFGIIDCLIKNENGEYEIWDWKTNIIKEIEELKIKYELQMLVYIYLLMCLYPNQNKYIARLISTELLKFNVEQEKWILTIEKTNFDKQYLEYKIMEMINNTLIIVNNTDN